jgi:hypothetical protein
MGLGNVTNEDSNLKEWEEITFTNEEYCDCPVMVKQMGMPWFKDHAHIISQIKKRGRSLSFSLIM